MSAGLLVGSALAANSTATVAGTLTRPAAVARPAAAYFSTTGGLTGVAAVSADSAWAVGYAGSSTSPKVLMLHWNGTKWSRVTNPKVLTGPGELNAITVVNAKDAWAAGFTGGFSNRRTLLLRWNGTAWREVTRPAPIPGFLNAVTATASSGWAVGGVPNGHNWPKALTLRLSSTTWSRVPVALGVEFTGVATTGKNSAWAIAATEQQYEFVHWNGHKWTSEFSILPVQDFYIFGGIAARPGGATFTVGYEFPNYGSQVPAILKLTGSKWQKVTVRAPSDADLNAVSFAPGGSTWTAGSAGASTLILRRNGTAWARVASPSPGSRDALDGLGFSSARNGWAVGTSGSRTLIIHWNGSAWT
jgi:hypothetical protein